MNRAVYPLLLLAPAFLIGYYAMCLYYPYPEPDIDAMHRFV
ncbi:hypothetical protein IBTHAUMO2_1000007 [Nitrosopumilaceae archaeon]|nr:hypothetical protein IBTHAUMO2_1000007 [Nitrosopumilaceae archaeon]